MRHIFIVVISILILSLFPQMVSGEKAPSFHLVSSEGKVLDSDSLKGKVILLNLITSHCPACHRQFTELRELHSKYPNVVIISVLLDNPGSLQNFKEENDITWYIALDTDNLSSKYNVMYTPTTVIIDKEGNIANRFVGWQDYNTLENSILSASSYGGNTNGVSTNASPTYLLFIFLISLFYSLFPMHLHAAAVEDTSDWKFKRGTNSLKFATVVSIVFSIAVGGVIYIASGYTSDIFLWISVAFAFFIGIIFLMNFSEFFKNLADKFKGNVIYKNALISSVISSLFFIPVMLILPSMNTDPVISAVISFVLVLIIGFAAINSEKKNSEKFLDKYWKYTAPVLGILIIMIGAYLLYINL